MCGYAQICFNLTLPQIAPKCAKMCQNAPKCTKLLQMRQNAPNMPIAPELDKDPTISMPTYMTGCCKMCAVWYLFEPPLASQGSSQFIVLEWLLLAKLLRGVGSFRMIFSCRVSFHPSESDLFEGKALLVPIIIWSWPCSAGKHFQ